MSLPVQLDTAPARSIGTAAVLPFGMAGGHSTNAPTPPCSFG